MTEHDSSPKRTTSWTPKRRRPAKSRLATGEYRPVAAKPIPRPGEGGAPDYEERFWERSEPEADGNCWNWQGALKPDGYGQFRIGKYGMFGPHRVAYFLENGPIPDGLVIDHLCANRACVNPDHLEAVSARENLLRGESRRLSSERMQAYNERRMTA